MDLFNIVLKRINQPKIFIKLRLNLGIRTVTMKKYLLYLLFFCFFSLEVSADADGFQIYYGSGKLKSNYLKQYMDYHDSSMGEFLRLFNSQTTQYEPIKYMEYNLLFFPKKTKAITNNFKFTVLYEFGDGFATGLSMTYANIYLNNQSLFDLTSLYVMSFLSTRFSKSQDIITTNGLFDSYFNDPLFMYGFIKMNLDRKKLIVDSTASLTFDLIFKTTFDYVNLFTKFSIPIPYSASAIGGGISTGFIFDVSYPFFISIEGYKDWYGITKSSYINVVDTGMRLSIGFSKRE